MINYRLSLERDPSAVVHPDHTEDGAAAVAWLYANAAAYGLDRTRIVIGGHSAGGHMTGLHALQTALLDAEDPDVHGALRGVIGIEGIYDLPLLVADYPEYRDDFVALAFGANESAWCVENELDDGRGQASGGAGGRRGEEGRRGRAGPEGPGGAEGSARALPVDAGPVGARPSMRGLFGCGHACRARLGRMSLGRHVPAWT